MKKFVKSLFIISLATFAIACSGTDGGDDNGSSQCDVPSGVYTVNYTDDGGNCPDQLVNTLTSSEGEFEVEADATCGPFERTDSQSPGDCTNTATVSGNYTDSGPTNATAELTVDCPQESNSCSHTFDVTFERQE